MLKKTAVTAILLSLLACPQVLAEDSDESGFGGASLPSEPTNTQTDQLGMPGNEPLAEPGATQKTGTQGSGSYNVPNLPKVTTGILSRPGTSIKDLPPARYAPLSEGNGLEGLLPARYAPLSNGEAGALQTKNSAVNLPPARYAVLSDGNNLIGDGMSKLKELGETLPSKIRATEGF